MCADICASFLLVVFSDDVAVFMDISRLGIFAERGGMLCRVAGGVACIGVRLSKIRGKQLQ